MFSKQTSFPKSVNKSPPLSSKFRINASGHLIPLLTKKWRVKLSSESVRHVQLLFLWDGRVASDTLNVFVSWQLHNINWQQVVVSRFYIIYCQSKTVHRRFSLPRVAFCVDFVGLYWTFLVVRHGKSFRCNGSYIPWIVSWTSFGFSFIESEVLLPCGSFDKVLLLPLQPSIPKWIVLLNHTVFKSASTVELPKRSFSNRTWISSSQSSRSIRLVAYAFQF